MSSEIKKSSLATINFLTGASDGILLPFWLCIVLFTVFPDKLSVIFFIGLVLSSIGAVIFGIARALGEINEIKHHHPQIASLQSEKDQNLLKHIGINKSIRQDLKNQIAAENDLWLKEIKENQLGWEKESPERAAVSGFQTGLGFLSGACLTLIPIYFLLRLNLLVLFPHATTFSLALLFFWPLFCLFVFSGFKANYIGFSFWFGGLKGVRNGVIALAIAFMIVYFVGVG